MLEFLGQWSFFIKEYKNIIFLKYFGYQYSSAKYNNLHYSAYPFTREHSIVHSSSSQFNACILINRSIMSTQIID